MYYVLWLQIYPLTDLFSSTYTTSPNLWYGTGITSENLASLAAAFQTYVTNWQVHVWAGMLIGEFQRGCKGVAWKQWKRGRQESSVPLLSLNLTGACMALLQIDVNAEVSIPNT